MKDLAYYNGRITGADEMMIPAGDRAFYFGDGIYDFSTVHNKKMFALKDHLDRFFGNVNRMKIDLGLTREELEKLCLELIDRLDPDVKEAKIYMQASRGTAPRNHAFPEGAKGNLFFSLRPGGMKELGRKVSAITKEDVRFEMCDVKTLNLLCSVLAQQEASEKGCYEAILHRGETVTEGSHSAVALIKGGCFVTPPLDRFILPSVSRKHFIEISTALGIPVREEKFTVSDMKTSDEVLIMSASAPLNVCEKIDGCEVGGRAPEIVSAYEKAYKKRIEDETGMKY
ncbi:MAG: aminotransferase class IV [Clostridia bacterium]|nr:aminotransferase class IV [Clostridia bacterium]